MTKPRHRLATRAPLTTGASITLEGNPAHYLTNVLRLSPGDAIAVFNRTQGEWRARITATAKRDITLTVEEQLRPAAAQVGLIVCFAPIKGGRMETIIEKATELGASVLQPVITQRTIVDKVNLDRAESIAIEAAEQCERTDWPEIREPVKLMNLIGQWPTDLPLIYGDESGESPSIQTLVRTPLSVVIPALRRDPALARNEQRDPGVASQTGMTAMEENESQPHIWAILAGPEGGFTPDEFAALRRLKSAKGVSLGPRILRADTAVITLCALTLAAWGDWDSRPRFIEGAN